MSADLFSVKGRTALVVGGTRGIGRAISLRLAQAGAMVLSNFVRDVGGAEALVAEARTAGAEIQICRADVTTSKGVDTLADAVAQALGTPSIMIFAAATGVHKRIADLTTRHFDWTFNLNVRAFFDLVHRFSDQMPVGASIVALSSEGAVRAIPQYSMVGASKGALESMARHFAAELAPRGIRVNVLSPGTVLTDAWKVLPDADRRLEGAASRSPLGRLVTLDEVAAVAQFLCSDAAAGIVGHTLVVDGGARIVG
jgi:NAD(P)-dependent dehydrogenase (short-subunit alcohol dehydrogenase family)